MFAAERLLIMRYLLPGIGGRLILLVAAIGVAGVTIGVASLILVIGVMNGAEARLAGQIAAVDGHIALTRPGHRLHDWRTLRTAAASISGVVAAVPTLEAPGMVTAAGRVWPADLQGVRVGHAPQADTARIGADLAARLGVAIGDPIAVTFVTRSDDGGIGVRSVGFSVGAVVGTGNPTYDTRRIVLPIDTLRRLLRLGDVASRIDVSVVDMRQVDAVAARLRRRLDRSVQVRSWRDLNATLFAALATEKVAMTLVVSAVTVIALFNILSSLMMLVRFKAREIAILRTIGMTRRAIAIVFGSVGTSIGVAGGALGIAVGLALLAAKVPILGAAKALFPEHDRELDVFLGVPLTIAPHEIASIAVAVLLGAVASTFYPAARAAAIDPAAVLRYD